MSEEIYYADATELARRIRAKELSPVEVLNAYLARIAAVNPKLNAIVTLVDDVIDQAKAAEKAVLSGDRLGPLHGVPFTIKDCIDTGGLRTTRGSRRFRDHVPTADATVVTRLKKAGGVFMAKTNLPEFALWWETDNVLFGRTVNPWNVARTTGGSSGGEAAALAAGLSPLGIGCDVGGSLRNPAHHCGVVALKATHGRVPLTGHWPESLLRAQHVGPMARTVGDVALGLSIIAGPDGADPYALPVPMPDLFLQPDTPPSGIRIGWNAGRFFGPPEPEVAKAVEQAARALTEAGYPVEEVSMPGPEDRDAQAISMTLYGAEMTRYLEPIVAGWEAEISPNIQRRMAVPTPTLHQYLEALEAWETFRQDMARFFHRYHLLLCPCVPVLPHPHNITELTLGGETVAARCALKATVPWDLTGSPAIAVPFGRSLDSLPIGVQLVGRHFDEATVLRAAAALEKVSTATSSHPPV